MSTDRHELDEQETTKVSISLPVKLKEKIELAAKDDRRSISNFLQVTLEQIFDGKERRDESLPA